MKIVVAIVLLIAAITADALDLKGVSPGQPWEAQVIQDKLNVNATGSDILRVHCNEGGCYGRAIFGTCSGITNVVSKDGMVDTISVELSINCYEKVTSLMLEKYGPASKTL